MTPISSSRRVACFGPFAADLATGEIYRDRGRVRIQEMPFRVLERLLSRAGDLVTRAELREALWPDETFVDFEHGLNAAVHKLRVALRDPARHARMIETLPGRGYRFAQTVTFSAHVRTSRAGGTARDAEMDPAAARDAATPDAATHGSQQLAIRGRMQLARRSADGILEALDTFAELVAQVPNSAGAHAGLAKASNLAVDWGLIPEPAGFAQSEHAAKRALALDPTHSEASAELGLVKHRRDWDSEGAEACYRTAVEHPVADEHAYQRFAEFLSQHGRHDEARHRIAQARAANPESNLLGAIEAWILYHSRDFAAARSACRDILRFDREFPLARYILGRVELADGRNDRAKCELEAAADHFGSNPFVRVELEIARSRTGDRVHWPDLPSDVSPYLTARLHLAQGRRQQALLDLEAAVERRCGWLADIGVDPELDALRNEPRFRKVREAVGV